MAKRKPAKEHEEFIALLDRYKCSVTFHAVRTRFIGSICSPVADISPLQTLKNLWDGEFPAFDAMGDVNHLLNALINGLWNELTAHQNPDYPFRLTPLTTKPTPGSLRLLALTRQQEIEGFVEGVFGHHESLDFPESAHHAMQVLQDLRGMFSGVIHLLDNPNSQDDDSSLPGLVTNLNEVSRILEAEMNVAIQSFARARVHGNVSTSMTIPTMH